MKYFDHDTDASKDSALLALRMECGGAAVDCYYAIIEEIYRTETDWVFDGNRPETKSVMHWLLIDENTMKTFLQTMAKTGLLESRENEETGELVFHSERAAKTIEAYRNRSKTAARNGKKGGRPKGSKTKRKPNENQTETQRKANETDAKAKEKEKEKELKATKELSDSYAEVGAGADITAPPSPEQCRDNIDGAAACVEAMRAEP